MIISNSDRFIQNFIGDNYYIEKLDGDASTREYFRIISPNKTCILCIDSSLKNIPLGEYPYIAIHDIFRRRDIPVPEVYSLDNINGLLLIEDLGEGILEAIYSDLSDCEIHRIYQKLIDIIVEIQLTEGDDRCVPFNLSFDIDKLMFEFNFFIKHALIHYFQADISKGELEKLNSEFFKISEILYIPGWFVLNHRDFHSRNIIIHQSKPFVIDFQDARMGLPQYDVVSLLRDSYLVLDNGLVETLKRHHYTSLNKRGYNMMTPDEYEYYFDILAFQRNVKAIGSFAYQVASLHNKRYEKYIAPTLKYLWKYNETRKELNDAVEIIKNNIGIDL
ncbi:MAG: phosphotransferase [Spirochaetota bacterium]|nr:phosphotransferase [Spirochaetota bacterium]